jgi:hypothetical protein
MASEPALIGSNCEAYGHPDDCEEPADGTVQSTSPVSVTVNGTDIATKATADMHFPSHSHDYDVDNGCHQDESHTLDPDDPGPGLSDSVTINGSPIYQVATGVADDPTSGGSIDIIDAGGNSSLGET